MYIRWNTTKKLSVKNIEAMEFAQAMLKDLDRIYGENTGVLIRDVKVCQATRDQVFKEGKIWLPPEDVQRVFEKGFLEYREEHWWKEPYNITGYKAVMLLIVHEFAHTLFFKWGMYEKGCKVHGRQFMDICRQIYRNCDFDRVYTVWKQSTVVYI